MKLLYYVLLLTFTGLVVSCKDSVITGEAMMEDNSQKVSFAIVQMPYSSPYGPKVVDDIFAGSIDRFDPESKVPPSPSSFGCFLSWANPKKDPKYKYYTRYIYVTESLIVRANNTYKQVKVFALSPQGPDGELMGFARCIVPSTPGIENMVEKQFEFFANRFKPDMEIDYDVQSTILDPALYSKSSEKDK